MPPSLAPPQCSRLSHPSPPTKQPILRTENIREQEEAPQHHDDGGADAPTQRIREKERRDGTDGTDDAAAPEEGAGVVSEEINRGGGGDHKADAEDAADGLQR